MIRHCMYLMITGILLLSACKITKINTTTMLPIFDKEGHRGCRGLMPENTLPAMLKAIDLGVTTLEMDIVFTKDSVAILSHEPFFNHEITTPSNGHFLEEKEERNYNIYKMSFKETQQYDVGIKPNPRFINQQKIKITKPSLINIIDSVEVYLSINNLPKIFYNIETKTNPATDNIYHPAPEAFVDQLMEIIKRKEIESRVIIQSFDFRTLQILHKKYPAIKTAMLIEANDTRSLEEQIKSVGFVTTIYSPAYDLVNKKLVDDCHNKKMKIVPWTVNDSLKINELKLMGVDGIITDYPNLFNK